MNGSIARDFLSVVLAPSRRVLCGWLGAALILGAPLSAGATEVSEAANEGGLGVASALASLVYGPLKVAYSIGGTAVAGCAWLFSAGDSEVANTVLTRAVRGSYVITPAALRGEEEIQFIGRSSAYTASAASGTPDVAAPPDTGESIYGW